MYRLSDDEIDYIRADLSSQGIETDDLLENLLDHLCCIIENELEESGDFHSFYASLIRRFYARSLSELEEETKALLIFKNYYPMKKVMLVSGIAAAGFVTTGLLFKFMHWPGAAMILFLGVVSLSLLFLPLMFILKIKENRNVKDKALTALAAIAAIAMSLAPFFKIMHWRGANMLGVVALGILVLLFLPVYFFTGIRKPETKVNTIVSSVLIIAGVGLFMSLARSPYGSLQQNLRATATFVRSDQICKIERKLLRSDLPQTPLRTSASRIDALCEELKAFIVEDQTGKKQLEPEFEKNNMYINDEMAGVYFKNSAAPMKKLAELQSEVQAYNEQLSGRTDLNQIPIKMTVFDDKEDKVVKALNDIVQIQLVVLQNQRLTEQQQ
jgi:hypothetical protein